MKNNPDLLQEAEVENADADITSDAGKINEYDNNMNISMEKDQDIVKYQKTFKVDVKNIAKKMVWRPVYEVICAPFFEETNLFLKHF